MSSILLNFDCFEYFSHLFWQERSKSKLLVWKQRNLHTNVHNGEICVGGLRKLQAQHFRFPVTSHYLASCRAQGRLRWWKTCQGRTRLPLLRSPAPVHASPSPSPTEGGSLLASSDLPGPAPSASLVGHWPGSSGLCTRKNAHSRVTLTGKGSGPK